MDVMLGNHTHVSNVDSKRSNLVELRMGVDKVIRIMKGGRNK
jgi:hypothetical protein